MFTFKVSATPTLGYTRLDKGNFICPMKVVGA